jgi:hypothetical protein
MVRFMVNLYKRSIRKGGLDPKNLKGNWSETSAIRMSLAAGPPARLKCSNA